ncbi:MAG: SprT-like domain-containing protein [Muribaculaceae bacterium]|nr:SprT-like domain-containing protein [Muribaculaceae bacterium]
MRADIRYVEERFHHFNHLIFGGKLPPIPVKMSDGVSFLGMCVAKVRRHPDGREEHYDFELRMSRRFDLSEREIEDVIIHEMIHYFIMYNELADTSSHGEIFKGMMRAINKGYGRNISISRRLSAEEKVTTASSKRSWHVVAHVRMCTGAHGVKVLPRVVPKILDYYKVVSASPDVASIELFLTDNPFFNRFPVSAAYKVHPVGEEEMTLNLVKAARLIVENGKLIQR